MVLDLWETCSTGTQEVSLCHSNHCMSRFFGWEAGKSNKLNRNVVRVHSDVLCHTHTPILIPKLVNFTADKTLDYKDLLFMTLLFTSTLPPTGLTKSDLPVTCDSPGKLFMYMLRKWFRIRFVPWFCSITYSSNTIPSWNFSTLRWDDYSIPTCPTCFSSIRVCRWWL